METTALSTLLENMGTVLTQLIDWTAEASTAMLSFEVLYIPLGMLAISFAVGLVLRFFKSVF